MAIWAIVVAAGSGERLGADRPKAFVRLGGRTMLAWSLAMLDDHDLIDGIVMVVPEEYEERASLLADDLCATKIAAAVPGGATRARIGRRRARVRARGRRVRARARRRAAARAARGRGSRRRGAARGRRGRRAGAAAGRHRQARRARRQRRRDARARRPARRADAAGLPGWRCCARRSRAHAGDATDCASMVERLGRPVVCVEGDERAFKVTTPADLARAEQLAGEDDRACEGSAGRDGAWRARRRRGPKGIADVALSRVQDRWFDLRNGTDTCTIGVARRSRHRQPQPPSRRAPTRPPARPISITCCARSALPARARLRRPGLRQGPHPPAGVAPPLRAGSWASSSRRRAVRDRAPQRDRLPRPPPRGLRDRGRWRPTPPSARSVPTRTCSSSSTPFRPVVLERVLANLAASRARPAAPALADLQQPGARDLVERSGLFGEATEIVAGTFLRTTPSARAASRRRRIVADRSRRSRGLPCREPTRLSRSGAGVASARDERD